MHNPIGLCHLFFELFSLVFPHLLLHMKPLCFLARCEDKVEARETAIGYVPYAKDINIEGLDLGLDTLEELLSVDKASWLEDVTNIKEFYAQVGDRVPAELKEELKALEARLA